MFSTKSQPDCLNLGQTGWKYYNSIRKKAVEQEFSWSGLLISMSIAFFIVVISASVLNFINRSITYNQKEQMLIDNNIYYLESKVYLSDSIDYSDLRNRFI